MLTLVEEHVIKPTDQRWKVCDDVCFKSKNVYNAALYRFNETYKNEGKQLTGFDVIMAFRKEDQPDYRAISANVASQTILQVHYNFRSFFRLNKKKQAGGYNLPVRPPQYLDKIKGRFPAIYPKPVISRVWLRKGFIKLSQIDFLIPTKQKAVQRVQITPCPNCYKIHVFYRVEEPEAKVDNKRYASIDLGVNNLAAVTSNVAKPFIINGRPLKSINHLYNAQLSKLQSLARKRNNKFTTNRIKSVTRKRNYRIRNYLHKASKEIVNFIIANDIHTLCIGYSKRWKHKVNLGRVNNQNFFQIPFLVFVKMLDYKCKLAGISVILIGESHTSKCSFLDNESVKTHKKYVGDRIKRGLFKTKNGILINADVNGSLNIMKKAVGIDCNSINSIAVHGTPVVLTMPEHSNVGVVATTNQESVTES